MKIKFLFLLVVLSNWAIGQNQQNCINFPSFKQYIYNCIEDPSKDLKMFPKPPKVTEAVLLGMEQEIIANDTAQIFMNRLSINSYNSDFEKTFIYFRKMDYDYTLLTLAAHWNPDIRVFSLIHLNDKLNTRPLVNSQKMKNGEWKKFDSIAIPFLIYLLESNPLFISGSENATIHGIYISNILWNLDLLTHEKIVNKKQLRDWYKNDLQLEQAVLKWKSHIEK